MKWFKHDSSANMDAKLQEVLLDYGLEGYGLYWYCLELIAANVDTNNLTFELEHDARIIARNTGATVQKTQEMMTKFVDLGLFENSAGAITCLKLARRTDEYTTKAFRKSGLCPDTIGTKSGQPPEKVPPNRTEQNRTEQNRTKERGGRKTFSPPAPQEVADYFLEKTGLASDQPQRFHDHYTSNGWMVNKNKMRDWKAAVRGWISREPSFKLGGTGYQTANEKRAERAAQTRKLDSLSDLDF